MSKYIIPFSDISIQDVATVGGKNASLGEMRNQLTSIGVNVPDGFAVHADGYFDFVTANHIGLKLAGILDQLDRETLHNLAEVSQGCRKLVDQSTLPGELSDQILRAFEELKRKYGNEITVAVRSSATAEDSPDASFAGQHDSFLNVTSGAELLESVKKCYKSLFNDRAIKYRLDNTISHDTIGQSVGVQMMVRSDIGSAGVAFTIDPEYGNKNLIYITGSWGLGETVVQGAVNTDEFYLFKAGMQGSSPVIYRTLGAKQRMVVYDKLASTKWMDTPPALRDQFVLSDNELIQLGKWCKIIEEHYNRPMDIEWARDGMSGKLFIVQARPETIHAKQKSLSIKEYSLKTDSIPVLKGKAVGTSIVSGRACIIQSLKDSDNVQKGDILVADITNPDWNTLIRKAVAIVTNKGGRTSHASIVARELGIPAVVGTLDATEKLKDGEVITVSCAEGDLGHVYHGKQEWTETETLLEDIQPTRTKPMFILADPMKAAHFASYPNEGVGLLRMEFIIANSVQVHPMALARYDQLEPGPDKTQIDALTRHFSNKADYFIQKLSESIALVAAAFYPKDVIVRLSDFKTNEYARLLGGKIFEPEEENPMLGFRGASRYYNDRYKEGFGLECAAIRQVRNEMELTNVKVMIPFCRTVREGREVLNVMKSFGLEQGVNGLEVYVMAEIPSNILMAEKFAEIFDGFSIGSNDLTQLTLGLDRDSSIVSDLFDEHDEAVTEQIGSLIEAAHSKGIPVGLCGQAPSDYPDYAKFLVESDIDSVSFNADSILSGIRNIMQAEGASHFQEVHR